jgi:ArsR family transcriptional regulator
MKPDYDLAKRKAAMLKALGHPTRLLIVEALGAGERCVCELNELVEADRSTVSKHLALLKRSGVVEDRKEGLKVYYRLLCPCVLQFMSCITGALQERVRRELEILGSGR